MKSRQQPESQPPLEAHQDDQQPTGSKEVVTGQRVGQEVEPLEKTGHNQDATQNDSYDVKTGKLGLFFSSMPPSIILSLELTARLTNPHPRVRSPTSLCQEHSVRRSKIFRRP